MQHPRGSSARHTMIVQVFVYLQSRRPSFGLSHVTGECAPLPKRDLEAHPCLHFSRALAHSQRRLVTLLTHPAQQQRATLPTPSRSRSSFCSIRAPLAGSRISTDSSQRAAHDALPRVCVRCTRRARVPRFSDLLRRDLGDLALVERDVGERDVCVREEKRLRFGHK